MGMDMDKRVRRTWEALSHGDLEPLEMWLEPEARWRAVQDGPWNCESRTEIVETMRGNLERGLSGEVEEVLSVGERTVVAFRPERRHEGEWPLDKGVRYVVLTTKEGLITEMKGCADRAVALAYADAG